MNLWELATLILILNLPFGYWRVNVRKLSRQWFLSIHLPVPVVIALRILSGIGWVLISFPLLVGAFFSGQFLGGKLHRWLKEHFKIQVTSCLVMDIMRNCRYICERDWNKYKARGSFILPHLSVQQLNKLSMQDGESSQKGSMSPPRNRYVLRQKTQMGISIPWRQRFFDQKTSSSYCSGSCHLCLHVFSHPPSQIHLVYPHLYHIPVYSYRL